MASSWVTEQAWAEAAQRCHLLPADVRLARELGFTPRSLLKTDPSPQQPWKAPVAELIRDLYEKRLRRTQQRRQRRERALRLVGSDKRAPAPPGATRPSGGE